MGGSDQGRRIVELERLLQEATETLDAIRNGDVDAIVVGGSAGQFVYTLENADRPYRVLVEQMKEGAVTLNEDGLVLYANRSFAGLVDRDLASLVGSSLFDHVDDRDALAAMLSAGQPVTTEVRLVTAQGGQTAVNMSIAELHVEAGAPRMFCSIVTDLSAMRRAEDALRQVQKMDAVGQLTGGVAHDFNNLLMAISSSLAMLEKRLPPDPQVRRLLENAQQGAQRGAALTQRMLAFARRQDLKPEQVDVAALTRGMTELIERTLGPTWPLELDLPDGLPRVLADANQLEMAILNLVVNARDATPEGGPIRIAAAQSTIAAGEANGLAAGDYLCLKVIDRGQGMDHQTLLRATEPFFTTKGVGKGTGLGLSMVDGLARQLDGMFRLESAPGRGTTASLWLPRSNGVVEPPRPSAGHHRVASTGPLKILAVDDDVLIRMNVAAMLEDMGHVVIEAASGDVALELLRQNPDIELLITDQAMPNITGLELIEHVQAERPDLPVILATGYGELPTASPLHIEKLSKPYSEQQLAHAVDKAMSLAAERAN